MDVQKDSDAGAQSQTGVGRVNQVTKALHEVQPNWTEDGYGIRGPQRQVVPKSNASPFPMDFRVDNSRNSPLSGGGAIVVTTEDATGYTPGTGVSTVNGVTTLTFDQDVFEIFDGGGGQCVVRLKTCDATCP